MDEAKSIDRRGRLTLINLPFELLEAFESPSLAMHVYSRVVYLSRHDVIKFKKGPKTVTLHRGECVFFARKFAARWNYSRPLLTRTVKAFEKLGFWTVLDAKDGFTIRVRPLQKVPGFAAAQVTELNRVSKELIAEARRDFLREQARALSRADQGLYRGLIEEFKAISDSYNSCNADLKPGSEPGNIDQILKVFETETTHREKLPVENSIEGDAPSALVNAALDGPPDALGGPAGSPGDERSPSASQAAVEPLEDRGDASGVAGEGEIEFCGRFTDYAIRNSKRFGSKHVTT